ncbi:CheR family methyltransferase [Chitinophaga sp. YR627]|uniref:CheR family methyltransferase n=1 Tax=Chitinophaga sp. YR627 TaxID=1881041 RepID=UPI00210170DF|nr:CheR family methyltransferase [Chitinophaga sp. YR627]
MKEFDTSYDKDNILAGRPDRDDLLVVGIGASAGGIRALQSFFAHVPDNPGMAYVVILHLSPLYESKLSELLQQVTPLKVTMITEKTRIQMNHVYVVPQDQHLMMSDNHILVSKNAGMEERIAPVDIFFRTLANSFGPRAVCVILSGTGANGSMGLRRIKECGGAAFVQNPREAEYNEMPRNAIATALVDDILPVSEIPEKILSYKLRLGSVEIPVDSEKRAEDEQHALREVFSHLRLRTGHDFSNYKRATLLRRIERRINIRNLNSLKAYAAYLQHNPDEVTALLKDLLISVTNFFRDKKAFEMLEQEVVPSILQNRQGDNHIRIWIAGCATGEEAYSLAMLFSEQAMGSIDDLRVQIFATDIDEAAIAVAREGYYSINDAADVSPERLMRFFNREGDGYRIKREVRETILFASHNFLKDPPFSHLDLVSCRNVLIYLNQSAQERVMETFHFALKPAGFLVLGLSESAESASDLYAVFNREFHIFQSRRIAQSNYPLPEPMPLYKLTEPIISPTIAAQENRVRERVMMNDLHQRLLEEYAPPSMVINEEYDILHLSERAGRYLQIAGGEPSQNLLKLVRQELRLELRSALYQAVQRQSAVEARGLKLTIDGQLENVNVHIRPVFRREDVANGLMLVIFEQRVEETGDLQVIQSSDEPVARQLEEELIRLKAQLRASIEQHEFQQEELKASNEELQAMNEELRSAAEELETSKEELQSINEELRTLNQELKVKVDETTIAGNNLQNLINSAEIATIFLDRSFRVALFTPPARNVFNLIANDIGRPLSDITNKLNYEGILSDAEAVLEKLQTIEREVTAIDGRSYLMRFLPYRTEEDRINGVVITLIDMTQHKLAEIVLRENETWMNGQKEAFQAAMNGQPLENSLAPLVRTVVDQNDGEVRAAFYICSTGQDKLHLVAGMSEEYAREINGSDISPESMTCGLAMHTGEPVIAHDIEEDPRWVNWRPIARKYNYRSCWSFPVRMVGGPVLGTFAMYFTNPRIPQVRELELSGLVAHAASIIISRHVESMERAQAEEALRLSEQRLTSLLRIREDFISVASHELKTPITSMKAYAEIVEERMIERGNYEDGELLGRLNGQIDRLTTLINLLLDATRLSEGQLKLTLNETDINKLVTEKLNDIKQASHHRFEVEIGELPMLSIDAERIGQVITNLLSNAIKYSPADTSILIKTLPEKDFIRVIVKDEGYGIPKEHQHKIFEKFYRITTDNLDTFPGMGLGLYISAQIIRGHQGSIEVDSQAGKGSTFSFTLPYKRSQV